MTRYASPVDLERYGPYRITRTAGDNRPLYRFDGRITAHGSTGFAAAPGRYHLYAGWFCPWAHRVTIERALQGLSEVISISYVDGGRDARGWGFRQRFGPDSANGFALLREAYDATEPDFDGHVSVPALWDRATGRVVSNNYTHLGLDLVTQFGAWAKTPVDTYPHHLRAEIDELDRWLGPAVNRGMGEAAGTGPAADAARQRLAQTFEALDRRLATSRYLLGAELTEADIRLWVSLVRYDVGPNAGGRIGRSLTEYPNLWAYARELYQLPAFGQTTDFSTFTAPGAELADWFDAHDRDEVGSGSAGRPLAGAGASAG